MIAPPTLAERLLRWSLADDERDAVLGDAHEEFAAIAADDPARAARWYWSQTALSIGPNFARRARKNAAQARVLETDEDRRSRLRARKWGLALCVCGLSLMAFRVEFAGIAAAYSVGMGALIFGGSFAARRVVSDAHLATQRRRVQLWPWVYALSFLPELVFGRTHATNDAKVLCQLIAFSFMWWPERYWAFGRAALPPPPPVAPQVRTPFIGLHHSRDGSLSLAIDAPEKPGQLGDPILVRAGDSRIGIDRLYSSNDAVRIFAVVAEGAQPPSVNIDLLDARGHVRRSISPSLLGADLVPGGKARAIEPKVPIAKIDATISLHDLAAGRYVLRLTAMDAAQRSDKYAEFTIVEP